MGIKRLLYSVLLWYVCSMIPLFAGGLRVLFIGDSITDGNWGNACGEAKPSEERNLWDMNHIYGSGYMYLCASHYLGNYPERGYEFFNRGISGNTLKDLENRWEKDVLRLKPDVLSVLVGTNDVYYYLQGDKKKPFDFVAWEKSYRSLLDCSLQANPELKLVLGAPFVAYTGNMRNNEDFGLYDSLVRHCAAIVEKIANDYGAVYLPYNELFDELLEKTPVSEGAYWIWDGIHPTPAGHRRMADLWMGNVNLQ